MNRIPAMLLVLTVFIAGCGSGSNGSGSDGSTADRSSETSPSPDQVSPLEGTWHTDPVSKRDIRATLRKCGASLSDRLTLRQQMSKRLSVSRVFDLDVLPLEEAFCLLSP
jgi:hypothetical protein